MRLASMSAVVVLSFVAASTVGCSGGSDDGDDEASPELVVEAADQSAAEAYEMTTTYFDGNEPYEILTGATDGRLTEISLSFEPMFEGGVPHMMEMVGDDTTQYVRTSVFTIGERGLLPEVPEAARPLQELGAEWGRVDMRRFGEGTAGIAATSGRPVAYGPPIPGPLFDVVSDSEAVDELGREEVDGEEMTGFSVEVSVNDLYPSRGLEPIIAEGSEDEYAVGDDVMVPLDVWIDDAGFIRRFDYEFDMAEVGEAVDGEQRDESIYRYRLDMYDYGAGDIRIELPAGPDAPDMTDAFSALLGENELVLG